MELFYVASYGLDNFRVFIASPFFHDVYEIESTLLQKLLTDEMQLMKFAARYLKQVLFGESPSPRNPMRSRSAGSAARKSWRSSGNRCGRTWRRKSTRRTSNQTKAAIRRLLFKAA
ncbi:MAG: hypothetical protein Tsb0026_02880 [Sulfuricaulis sp.]